jgi:hypothetical protein
MVMIDRISRDDLERIRLGKPGRHWLADNLDGGGVPAFLGQVTTPSSLIGVGKFLMVQPTSVLGPEAEGGSGQFTAYGSSTVPVYLVGPDLAVTGDYLVCRFVDNRWAAERSTGSQSGGGSTGTTIIGCECPKVPTSLTMISTDPSCNFGMFQSCSIQYGPTPAGYADLQIGVNSYLSVESFPDLIGNGAMFQYLLTCYYNQFNLSRVYLESPYGSPYRDGLLYTWLVGGYGNTCVPFALDDGVPYPGSDASCFVTINGA